jgi:hypothetical protein
MTTDTPGSSAGGWGPGSTLEIHDVASLDRAAGVVGEIDSGTYAALRAVLPDTEAAAPALGNDWATSAALGELSRGWNAKLVPLAVQVGGFGERLTETANAYRNAMATARRHVGSLHAN